MIDNEIIIPEIVEAIQDKKGFDIRVLDLSDVDGASTSTFIIASGKSTPQVSAIADSVRERLQKNLKEKPINYDGYRNSQWIIIDYGNIMVHIFLPEYREFYNLEDLWSDAKISVIPNLDDQ